MAVRERGHTPRPKLFLPKLPNSAAAPLRGCSPECVRCSLIPLEILGLSFTLDLLWLWLWNLQEV